MTMKKTSGIKKKKKKHQQVLWFHQMLFFPPSVFSDDGDAAVELRFVESEA